ncbi:DUF1903-domain-containing protein [Dentipellis sp. KUC8613]|nr:DUF1903-domain-containing protein [Dentipellis sp. KUC8613]
MPPKGPAPCQAEACALQDCLSRHTYTPDKCETLMRKLYNCCDEMYRKTDDGGESTACPMPSVVRRWLKTHPGT